MSDSEEIIESRVDERQTYTALNALTWHRAHPLSPVMRSWKFLLALLFAILSQARDAVEKFVEAMVSGKGGDANADWLSGHTSWIWIALAAIVGIAVGVGLVSWILWRVYTYASGPDSFHVRSGIITKSHKEARYSRVQSVDVLQPFLARILGLSILRFDVAGGADSALDVAYLKLSTAQQLRDDILTRVREAKGQPSPSYQPTPSVPSAPPASQLPADAAIHANAATPSEANPDSPLAPSGGALVRAVSQSGVARDLTGVLNETLAPYDIRASMDERGSILRIPPHQVLWTTFLSRGLLFTAFLIAVIVMLMVGAATDNLAAAAGAATPFVFAAIAGVAGAFKAATKHMNFSVAITPDGLLVTHGVTTTLRRVIPLNRLQAIRVEQPLLWRPLRLWRVKFTIAGGSGKKEFDDDILCPAGTLEEVLTLLGLVLPQPGLPADVSPRDVVVSAMTASNLRSQGTQLFKTQPPRARLLNPLTYPRNGFLATATMLVIAGGRFTRDVDFVPHARVQSLAWTQGPVRRWRGAAVVEVHPTKGPIEPRIPAIEAARAQEFFLEHSARTQAARREIDAAERAAS